MARKRHMAKERHERATDAPVPAAVATGDPKVLHEFLAAYFAALATAFPPHPPPLGTAGLSALVHWQNYFNNPDHLQPQDIPFVRGRIWS
jgi:hypothetical protein